MSPSPAGFVVCGKTTFDVFACVRCGGRRRVLASLTAPGGGRAIVEHLALPSRPAKRAPAQGPPQSAGC
ncbi:ATP-dependent helicase HrpA [Pyxidicoccus fallax]|uniref:ATP-dependent helicase HrpA n=1 Tax=Pyxidicoccus fallax TaxID=394095 RepID=A0A848LGP5_9BACT|nr:ATP-dependent helicase HrpA [Pyxidicoccus fallax]NPC76990.1 ATP-dependent helicase HrpA [Pyxidicoccus fallax]